MKEVLTIKFTCIICPESEVYGCAFKPEKLYQAARAKFALDCRSSVIRFLVQVCIKKTIRPRPDPPRSGRALQPVIFEILRTIPFPLDGRGDAPGAQSEQGVRAGS